MAYSRLSQKSLYISYSINEPDRNAGLDNIGCQMYMQETVRADDGETSRATYFTIGISRDLLIGQTTLITKEEF